LGYHGKSKEKKRLNAPKFKHWYNISQHFSKIWSTVYYMKMVRIFQQCTNCFEKESSVTTVAGLVEHVEKENTIF
jgi:hypothetical protein